MYARSVGSSRQRTGRSVHIASPKREAIVPPPDYSGTAIQTARENRPIADEPFESLFRDGSREEESAAVQADQRADTLERYNPEPFTPRQESESQQEQRYPLYEQQPDEPQESPMKPWITRRRENDRRTGMNMLGNLLPSSLEMDDMLLAALIILLLANGSDEETILILAFLLLVK